MFGFDLGVKVALYLLIAIPLYFIGGKMIHYTLNKWAEMLNQQHVEIPFMPCGIIAIFFTWFFIPVFLVTWLMSAVMRDKLTKKG